MSNATTKPISRRRRSRLRIKAKEFDGRGIDFNALPSLTTLELLDLIDAQSDELRDLRREVKRLARERDPLYMRLPD